MGQTIDVYREKIMITNIKNKEKDLYVRFIFLYSNYST